MTTHMRRILLIDDCFPINTRNKKILDSLEKHYGKDVELSVIAWDRNNTYKEELKGYHIYKKDSPYGNKTRKFFNLLGYRKFCFSTIKALQPDVVIASHWNNLLMVPKLNRQKQMLIYENLDIPTGRFILRKLATTVERLQLKRVDLTIHASRFYTKLYSPKIKQLILENKPPFQAPSHQDYVIHQPLRIAFIGLLRYREISKALIDAVRNDNRFQLYFHGDGHAKDYLEGCAEGAVNIFFTGRYAYEDVAKLYQQTDVVWAAYPNKDFNVIYAISNKFHESLTFGIPTVYADKTCLGDFVTENHIGLAVNPYSTEAIKSLLDDIYAHHDKLRQLSNNMRSFGSKQTTWDENFMEVKKAIDNFFHNFEYIS